MGILQSLRARAGRSPRLVVGAVVVVLALIAGGVLLATRPGKPPAKTPYVSTRAVALGDSVPYGHGLANPYLTPQLGLPKSAVSQGPSPLAYPSAVAAHFGLTMSVRPTNCKLVGDQLAISGAVADPADNTARDGQCPVPPQPARNLDNEIAAADLAAHPARLVLIQDGADDIDFATCLEYQLAEIAGQNLGLGTQCVSNGAVTPKVAADLANVRQSLAHAIEEVAPHAGTVAVLNYYQPVPAPSAIADDTGASGLGVNLVCTGLKANGTVTAAAAQVVLAALNHAVAGAVADARADHVSNVSLVDLSSAVEGHGMCSADPWIFSGERVSDAALAADAEHVLAAKACNVTSALHGSMSCAALVASADAAERSLQGYVWRAAHPTAAGQRAITAIVERDLQGKA
jgi:hypothetical protein